MNITAEVSNEVLNRAQGCLLGQIAGDSLGSLVEFSDTTEIYAEYPDGLRILADGGVWDTLAGQPTDDSEMALALARSIVRNGTFDLSDVHESYVRWSQSDPFDIGSTCAAGLRGKPRPSSQANGALMRVSPLGIFGWNMQPDTLAQIAAEDSALTHQNQICQQVNQLYAVAISDAVRDGCDALVVYERLVARSEQWNVESSIKDRIKSAQTSRPMDYSDQMGWVLTAFQNVIYELLHAQSLEEGVVATVHCGGDTDTNAAICGALLGAVYGLDAIPKQWRDRIVNCEPTPQTMQPRPEEYWPNDSLGLAKQLVLAGLSATETQVVHQIENKEIVKQ